jgi:hypothetical protein
VAGHTRSGAPTLTPDREQRLRRLVADLVARCDVALAAVAADGGPDRATHLQELRRVLLRAARHPTPARRAEITALLRALDGDATAVRPDGLPALVTDLGRVERALDRVAAVGHRRHPWCPAPAGYGAAEPERSPSSRPRVLAASPGAGGS